MSKTLLADFDQVSLVADLDCVCRWAGLAKVFHVKHLPQDAVLSSPVRQHRFSPNSSAPSKNLVRETTWYFGPVEAGRKKRRKKRAWKALLQMSIPVPAYSSVDAESGSGQEGSVSRLQPSLFPWESSHPKQAINLGKKIIKPFLHAQSRIFNKRNLWESNTTQLKPNYVRQLPRMT